MSARVEWFARRRWARAFSRWPSLARWTSDTRSMCTCSRSVALWTRAHSTRLLSPTRVPQAPTSNETSAASWRSNVTRCGQRLMRYSWGSRGDCWAVRVSRASCSGLLAAQLPSIHVATFSNSWASLICFAQRVVVFYLLHFTRTS